jgi:hypothetical protein
MNTHSPIVNRRDLLKIAALSFLPLSAATMVAGVPVRQVKLLYDFDTPHALAMARSALANWASSPLSNDIITSWNDFAEPHLAQNGVLIGITSAAAYFCLERLAVRVGAHPRGHWIIRNTQDGRDVLARVHKVGTALLPTRPLHPAFLHPSISLTTLAWVISAVPSTQGSLT